MENWTPDNLKSNLDNGKTVFLKLWQKGCGPCKLSESATKRLAEKEKYDQIVFAQILTDEHPEMLDMADTTILPVFFAFKDKKMSGKSIGFKGIKELQTLLDDLV